MPTMRLRLKLFVSLAALAVAGCPTASWAACTPVVALPASDLVTPGKLQMSINPTLPPQQFVDSKGELQGLNVEIGHQIADKLCLEMEFIRMDFPPMIPALQGGRFDAIDTGLFWTEERSKILFLVPYAMQSISVTVPVGSALKLSDIDDLSGKTVVIEVNTYQERWLKGVSDAMVAKGKAPITVRGFTTATDAMAALRAGQGDAAALLDYMARDMTKRGLVKTELFQLGGAASTIAFRNRTAAEAVAKALTALRDDGEYGKLFDKFGLSPLPADQPFAIRGPGPV